MSESKVMFNLENPPAVTISLGQTQNMDHIKTCIEGSHQDYQATVQCIDTAFDIKQIIEPSPDIPLG